MGQPICFTNGWQRKCNRTAHDQQVGVIDFQYWNDQVLAAHKAGDSARLAQIYHHLGRDELRSGDEQAGAFLLVQAYVYALESGADCANEIHGLLKDMGREA